MNDSSKQSLLAKLSARSALNAAADALKLDPEVKSDVVFNKSRFCSNLDNSPAGKKHSATDCQDG